MTYTQLLFVSLLIALNVAICVTTLVMVNTTQQMLYDFKKEFRRFRDGEQYQCRLELDNPVIGVKLNADGNWSEIRANDKQKAKWIHREDLDFKDKLGCNHFHGMCGNCGFIHDFIDHHTGQYKYCPQCGQAVMWE